MIKNMLLCFVLTSSVFAADTWKYNNKKETNNVETVGQFPEFLDKVWQLAAVSDGVPYYLNLKDIEYNTTLSATTLYVKQFDLAAKRTRVIKYAYRNNGEEFAGLGMRVYDENNNFLNEKWFKLNQVEWSQVRPGTVASDVLDKLREFLTFVQRERNKGNTDNTPSTKKSKSTTKA